MALRGGLDRPQARLRTLARRAPSGLGIVTWIGGGNGIVPLHMLVGVVLVAGLWVLAVLGLRAGPGPGLPAIAFAWGIPVVLFGINQASIQPGGMHLVVEVAHLLIGIVAIGIGEAFGARTGRLRATA